MIPILCQIVYAIILYNYLGNNKQLYFVYAGYNIVKKFKTY